MLFLQFLHLITLTITLGLFVGRISLYWVLLAVVFEAIGGGITVSVTMINLILFVLVSQESR
jgi:hypothetical protein